MNVQVSINNKRYSIPTEASVEIKGDQVYVNGSLVVPMSEKPYRDFAQRRILFYHCCHFLILLFGLMATVLVHPGMVIPALLLLIASVSSETPLCLLTPSLIFIAGSTVGGILAIGVGIPLFAAAGVGMAILFAGVYASYVYDAHVVKIP